MSSKHTVNYATNMSWLCSVPFRILFPAESDVRLNLTQFDIPEINIGVTEVSYQGYTIEQPTGLIQPEDKSITFNYLLDKDMTTYWLLYKWAGFFTDPILDSTIEPRDTTPVEPVQKYVPITVFILDEWKKPVMKVTYFNCWIKSFANLSMSYQDEPIPLNHNFTIAYSHFEIERVTSI